MVGMDSDHDSDDSGSGAMDISDNESTQESDMESNTYEQDTQAVEESPLKQENGSHSDGTLHNHNHISTLSAHPNGGLNGFGAPHIPSITRSTDYSHHVPGAVWQKIFRNLSPVQLARCTQVCKTFETLLLRTYGTVPQRGLKMAAQLVPSESIWVHARRATYEKLHLPKPLPGFSESGMLQLAACDTCQNCGKQSVAGRHVGYLDHVRPIWQFEYAVCGECLTKVTLTVDELESEANLLSSQALKSGLTYVYLVKDGAIVFEGDDAYLGLPAQKLFSKQERKILVAEYEHNIKLGDAAAEGWIEGLEIRRDEAMKQAARWSRWEASLPPGTNIRAYLHSADPATKQSSDRSKVNTVKDFPSQTRSNDTTVIQTPTFPTSMPPRPTQIIPEQHNTHPATDDSLLRMLSRSNVPPAVQEKRRKRAEEICRRCADLTPPITPDILQHLTSYTASLQLSRLLTEDEWTMLKPRLEYEKEQWEQQDYERRQREALVQINTWNARDLVTLNKVPVDPDWERAQEIVRAALVTYAEERINTMWPNPASRSGRDAPVFAVDVLKHMVERWNETTANRTSPIPLVLTLGAMKQVYVSHVFRHASEKSPPEIFICAECSTGTRKWLSFEGLIQHYGAVHTEDFSSGNSPVDWRASWPRELPFQVDVAPLIRASEVKIRREEPRHDPAPQRNSGRRATDVVPANTAVTRKQQTSEMEQLQKTAQEGLSVWTTLSTMAELESCIRVQITLTSMFEYHQREFEQVLSTGKLVELVAGDINLEPLYSAPELMCANCEPFPARNGRLPNTTYYERKCSKKLFNFHTLLNHFHMAHLGQPLHNWPWPGCVDLPEGTEILRHKDSPAMTDEIFSLIVERLPQQLVKNWTVRQAVSSGDGDVVAKMVRKRFAPQQNSKRKKSKAKNHGQNSRVSAYDSQDEYDPEDPNATKASTNDTRFDPSKYDRDWSQPPERDLERASPFMQPSRPVIAQQQYYGSSAPPPDLSSLQLQQPAKRRAPDDETPSPRLTKRNGDIAATQPVPLLTRAPHTRAPSYNSYPAPSTQPTQPSYYASMASQPHPLYQAAVEPQSYPAYQAASTNESYSSYLARTGQVPSRPGSSSARMPQPSYTGYQTATQSTLPPHNAYAAPPQSFGRASYGGYESYEQRPPTPVQYYHTQQTSHQYHGQIDYNHQYAQQLVPQGQHVGQDLYSSLLVPQRAAAPTQYRPDMVTQGGYADRHSLPARQTPHRWTDAYGRLFQRDESGHVVELEPLD